MEPNIEFRYSSHPSYAYCLYIDNVKISNFKFTREMLSDMDVDNPVTQQKLLNLKKERRDA